MFRKIFKFFFPITFILISCSNDQVSDIQKSAAYNLDDYQVIIRSPNGLCINSDLVEEKSESLVLVLTECIKNPDTNDLIRRPISSLITVKFQKEIGLNKFNKISDFIKSKDVKLDYIFKTNNLEIALFKQVGQVFFSQPQMGLTMTQLLNVYFESKEVAKSKKVIWNGSTQSYNKKALSCKNKNDLNLIKNFENQMINSLK